MDLMYALLCLCVVKILHGPAISFYLFIVYTTFNEIVAVPVSS